MIIKDNFDLTNFNSYNISSFCARVYFPENEYDLISVFSNQSRGKKIIIGNGNNIILSKSYYSEDFIIFNGNYDKYKLIDTIVESESGATLEQISLFALQKGLKGFEIYYDIPSSVGGAVVMNAGASGVEVKDILLKVRYLDLKDLKVKEKKRSEIGFEYRNSFFQKNADKIILKAWFQLEKGNPGDIKKKMEETKKQRWAKQPRDFPNCGSVFKRPHGRYVGTMIEELGLKGYAIGGARVSKKHAGFIENFNNATGEEIIKLIEYLKEMVYKKYGVLLEIEQRII